MKLDKFISQTLEDIMNGVICAQEKVKKSDAEINPYVAHNANRLIRSTGRVGQDLLVNDVDFEVLLTNEGGGSAEGSLGVFFANIGVGTKAKIQNSTIETTKIRFSVPICYPPQTNS